MTNSKTTKRALLLSVLSILMCVAMLTGSTFAWFTDSVTSGKNKIVAGNLEVELLYAKPDPNTSLDQATWTTVSEKTDLFKEGTLWEPGHVEVVYLKIENKGTLALDYNLKVYAAAQTKGTNQAGEDILLAHYLKFGMIPDVTTAYADRAAAVAAVDTPLSLGGASAKGEKFESLQSKVLALVVWMPSTVGNEANYKTGTTPPTIDLAIRLEATQAMHEEDGFGNDYDEFADGTPDHPEFGKYIDAVITVPGAIPVTSADDKTVSTEKTVNAGDIEVTYPVGTKVTGEVKENAVDATQGFVFTGSESKHRVTAYGSQTLSVYELTLPVADENTVLVKIVEKIGKNQDIKDVYHNGTKLTEGEPDQGATITGNKGYYTYDESTGKSLGAPCQRSGCEVQ